MPATESPCASNWKIRSSPKGMVKRDVIEVVTPGVAFSDKVLEQKQNNYLAAIAFPHSLANGDEIVGLAFVDVTTAEFNVQRVSVYDNCRNRLRRFTLPKFSFRNATTKAMQQLLKQSIYRIVLETRRLDFQFRLRVRAPYQSFQDTNAEGLRDRTDAPRHYRRGRRDELSAGNTEGKSPASPKNRAVQHERIYSAGSIDKTQSGNHDIARRSN